MSAVKRISLSGESESESKSKSKRRCNYVATIKNYGSEDYSAISVTVTFYSEDKELIGSSNFYFQD